MCLGGFDVTFQHYRRHDGRMETSCVVRVVRMTVGVGIATCALTDNFSRAKGRKVALRKALLKSGNFTKEARTIVWRDYFEVVGRK